MDLRRVRILCVVLVVIIGAVLVVNQLKPQKEVRNYTPAAINLQNSWLHGGALYFYSSSFFAKYNLTSNTVDQLSDYLVINSGISSPNWSDHSVVFQTTPQVGDRDDVTTIAGKLGVADHSSHWWRYTFSNHQYQLLNFAGIDNCTVLQQINDSLLTCSKPTSSGDIGSEVTLYNLDNKTTKTVVKSDDTISNITSDSKTIYFVVTSLGGKQTLYSVDINSSQKNTLYETKESISYHDYGDQGVLVNEIPRKSQPSTAENEHEGDTSGAITKQKILLIKDGGIVFDKKISSLPLYLYADENGGIQYSSIDGSISTIQDNKREALDPATKNQLGQSDILFKVGERFFVLTSDNKLSSSPAVPSYDKYAKPSEFNVESDNDQAGKSFIDRSDGGVQTAYLFRSDISASQQQQIIGDRLKSHGYRPFEFNFVWKVDSSDYKAPVSPNFTGIQ